MYIVREKCQVDGEWFDEYLIRKVEWDLETYIVGVVVLYYKYNLYRKIYPASIRTYYFTMAEEVDVNELIDKVIQLHK